MALASCSATGKFVSSALTGRGLAPPADRAACVCVYFCLRVFARCLLPLFCSSVGRRAGHAAWKSKSFPSKERKQSKQRMKPRASLTLGSHGRSVLGSEPVDRRQVHRGRPLARRDAPPLRATLQSPVVGPGGGPLKGARRGARGRLREHVQLRAVGQRKGKGQERACERRVVTKRFARGPDEQHLLKWHTHCALKAAGDDSGAGSGVGLGAGSGAAASSHAARERLIREAYKGLWRPVALHAYCSSTRSTKLIRRYSSNNRVSSQPTVQESPSPTISSASFGPPAMPLLAPVSTRQMSPTPRLTRPSPRDDGGGDGVTRRAPPYLTSVHREKRSRAHEHAV